MNLDKIRGMLWGAAVGDALGGPHEFNSSKHLEFTGLMIHPLINQSRFHGSRVGVVGQITDDTEMMFALSNSILASDLSPYDPEDAIEQYLDWAGSKCPFMGKNTRNLFSGVKTVRGYKGRYKKIYGPDSKRQEWSQSNGCLMRCAPLAVLNDSSMVAGDCSLSNPHPICVASCQAYCKAIWDVAHGVPFDKVMEIAIERCEVPEVKDLLVEVFGGEDSDDAASADDAADADEADSSPTRDVTVFKGWVLHALWCAFQALRRVDVEKSTYEATIDWIIRLCGDTDTNACIAGALIGARLGYDALEAETRTGKNIETVRGVVLSHGDLSRPETYQSSRIDEVAEALRDATE